MSSAAGDVPLGLFIDEWRRRGAHPGNVQLPLAGRFSLQESLTLLLVLCCMFKCSLAKGEVSLAARTMARCDSIIGNLSGRTPCYTRRTGE
jgi:hypothetical protein